MGPAAVLALQRAAGNAAVGRVLGAAARIPAGAPTVQRAPAKAVGPISVNNTRISVPVPAGASLQATVPAGQPVTWSLAADTAAIDAGTSIDAAGLVTIGGTQAGGRITVKADDSGGSGSSATRPVGLLKAPGSIASTKITGAAGGKTYGAKFRHTFAAVGGGKGSECEGVRVNEMFAGIPTPMATSHAMTTPFGSFTLNTNDPAGTAAGWVINSSGEMGGDDHVTIGNGVDIRPLVKNTSNPTPANTLPASFSAAQSLRSLEVPTNTFRAAFATPAHVRGLREPSAGSPEFFVSANGTEHVDKYVGKPAVRNAKAASPTVVASEPPPPKPKKGAPAPPAVVPTTVQITAESTPTGAPLKFSIQGEKLGCKIDAKSGLLTIGVTAGSVTVRAAEAEGRSYDEVVVTITARPAPAPTTAPGTPAAPGAPGGKKAELGEEFADPDSDPEEAFA